MAEFTFGKVNLSTASGGDGVDNLRIRSYEFSGDVLSLDGLIRADPPMSGQKALDAVTVRRQLLGYDSNPDEPVIPLTWSRDTGVNGFYRVRSVEVGNTLNDRLGLGLAYPWKATVERVPGYQAPLIEAVLSGALRVNTHSILVGTTEPWWAHPVAATAVDIGATVSGPHVRVGADGQVRVWRTTDGTLLYDRSVKLLLAAGDWYDSSARIEFSADGGTTYRAIIGRQPVNLPAAWRLSTDLLRVTPSFDSGTLLLDVSHYDGSAWETAKRYKATWDTVPDNIADPDTFTILRNTPECCIIRLWFIAIVGSASYLDLALRRGSRYVEGFIGSTRTAEWGIYRNTAEAATAHTSGVHATSTDASGNKYILTTPNAKTNDVTQGGFRLTAAAATFAFMIGAEIDSAAPADSDAFQDVVDQYFAATNEVQRIGQR